MRTRVVDERTRLGWAVMAVAGVAAASYILVALLPMDPRAKSALALSIVALGAAGALGLSLRLLPSITGRDRRSFIYVCGVLACVIGAMTIGAWSVIAAGRLTRSPSPDDLFYLSGLVFLLLASVEIGSPLRSRPVRVLGNTLDFAALIGVAFAVGFVWLLYPLGIIIPTTSATRALLMGVYFSAPIAIAVFPAVFRDDPWLPWAGLTELGISSIAASAVTGIFVVGLREYYFGSPLWLIQHAWTLAATILFAAAAVWRSTPRRVAGSPKLAADLPSWPGIAVLAMAVPGVPFAIYFALEVADRFTGVVLGITTSAIAAILMTRSILFATTSSQVESVRREVAEYRSLAVMAPMPVVVVTGDGRIQYANGAAAEALGYTSPFELLGQELRPLIESTGGGDFEELRAMIAAHRRGGQVRPLDLQTARMRRRDGGHVDIEFTAVTVTYAGQSAALIQGVDVTSRLEAEADAARYQAKLKALAGELVATEERERHRLAQALHDQVSQQLAVAQMRLKLFSSGVEADEDLRVALELIDDALSETRDLTTELAPQVLYDLGLTEALRWLCGTTNRLYGLSCSVRGLVDDRVLTEERRALLFRSVRELVMNTVKHARAEALKIIVEQSADEVVVTVSDDGRGFDTDELATRATFGLMSVEESLAAVGGGLQIDSRPGVGTRATVRMRVTPPGPDGADAGRGVREPI